jgi:hypothetical protein
MYICIHIYIYVYILITGRMWGYENLGIEPDVITSAKVHMYT